MNYLLPMAVFKTQQNLTKDVLQFCLRQFPVREATPIVVEFSARQVFHDDAKNFFLWVWKVFVKLDDSFVLELTERLNFFLHEVSIPFPVFASERDKFQSHLPLSELVKHKLNGAKTSFT